MILKFSMNQNFLSISFSNTNTYFILGSSRGLGSFLIRKANWKSLILQTVQYFFFIVVILSDCIMNYTLFCHILLRFYAIITNQTPPHFFNLSNWDDDEITAQLFVSFFHKIIFHWTSELIDTSWQHYCSGMKFLCNRGKKYYHSPRRYTTTEELESWCVERYLSC